MTLKLDVQCANTRSLTLLPSCGTIFPLLTSHIALIIFMIFVILAFENKANTRIGHYQLISNLRRAKNIIFSCSYFKSITRKNLNAGGKKIKTEQYW